MEQSGQILSLNFEDLFSRFLVRANFIAKYRPVVRPGDEGGRDPKMDNVSAALLRPGAPNSENVEKNICS